MRFKSGMMSSSSGSLGGLVFSHNAGGQYVRARVTPTNPGTIYQTTVRQIVASLVNLWANVLTQAQRDAWDVYAGNVPLPDVFGDPRYRSGINHYVRSNTPRLQFGVARIDVAPGIFDVGEYTLPVVTAQEAGQTLTTAFTDADDWTSEDGAALLSWCSRPQNPSILFFKGPYRAQNIVLGNSVTPPTNPDIHSAPFNFVEGQKLFTKYNVIRSDGRLGTVTRTFCLAAA